MPDTATQPLTTPDKESIRAEIESTRADFHTLLDSLSADDWKRKSANPAWTVGQLMYHLAWGGTFVLSELKSAKRGKGFNPPQFLINPVNVAITRFGAMRSSRASIERKYDDGMEQLLRALNDVQPGEWEKSSTNFGVTHRVQDVFHIPAEHLAEHTADIRKGLGRA